MKRNPDLIRSILLKVEQSKDSLRINDFSFDGFSPDEVKYHLNLLIEAGYLIGKVQYADDHIFFVHVSRLTWKGHDFVEASRSESIWKKAKEKMQPAGDFVLELAIPVLTGLIKQQLDLP